MKRNLLSLAGVLGTSLLVGCSSGNQATGDVTELTFWHSMGGKGGEAIASLVEEFNSSQEGIKVVAEYQGAYDDAINNHELQHARLPCPCPSITNIQSLLKLMSITSVMPSNHLIL